MRKKLWCFVRYISIVFFIIVIVSIMLFYTHRDKSISNGRFEAIELHSEEGNYISYAIKLASSYHTTWEFVVPQWFSKYFDCHFYWCANSNDFIILSSDTGLHLYIFDFDTETWHGDYYLKAYVVEDNVGLYYWDRGSPIATYSPDSLPNEVVEYIKKWNDGDYLFIN